jgi:NAD(P)-dependent dehydrogenase (short-subunit alcohol dehydrogenase family)
MGMPAKESSNGPTLQGMLSSRGKRTLITGAASGIGRAMAERFAEAGSSLELVDIDEEGLHRAQEELGAKNAEVYVHRTDLSKKTEIDSLWEGLRGREPDVLVNNADVYPFRAFAEVDEASLNGVLSINLNAVFWMCQKMAERRGKEGGVIINVSSIEAILPFKDGLTHYGPSKAGVIALSRALAKELGRKGFRVNVILPGGIDTPGTRGAAKGLLKGHLGLIKDGVEFMSRLPLGRMGDPDEVARMAVVLASDLSSCMTGALVPVDGGFLSA